MDNTVPGPTRGLVGREQDPRDAPREDRMIGVFEDDGRERQLTGNATIDPFEINDIRKLYAPTNGDPKRGNVNNEIDFNWKRYEVYGKKEPAEDRAYQAQGWRPVLHTQFPGRFAEMGAQGPVIVKDMILMWRPMRLTVQAREEEYRAATRAVQVNRQKVAETAEGQAPRIVFADRTTREAIPIPD